MVIKRLLYLCTIREGILVSLSRLRVRGWQRGVRSTDRRAFRCVAPGRWLSGCAHERESATRSCVTVVSPLFTLDRQRSTTQSLSENEATRASLGSSFDA